MPAHSSLSDADDHSGRNGKSSQINRYGNSNCILQNYDGDLLAMPGSLPTVSCRVLQNTLKDTNVQQHYQRKLPIENVIDLWQKLPQLPNRWIILKKEYYPAMPRLWKLNMVESYWILDSWAAETLWGMHPTTCSQASDQEKGVLEAPDRLAEEMNLSQTLGAGNLSLLKNQLKEQQQIFDVGVYEKKCCHKRNDPLSCRCTGSIAYKGGHQQYYFVIKSVAGGRFGSQISGLKS